MFEWIDQGWTVRGIATYLTSQHIPTDQGEIWDARSLRRIIDTRYLNLATNRPILAYGYLMVLDENNAAYTELSVSQLVYEKLDQGMDASKIAQFLKSNITRVCELFPLLIGVVLYFWCAGAFTFIGKGTPAPIDAPIFLVRSGPYRWVRNPMYLAGFSILIGEAILFHSLSLFGYLLLK